MCALVDDLLLDSGQTVEDDGACSALDIVQRRLDNAGGDSAGDDPAEEGAWDAGHYVRMREGAGGDVGVGVGGVWRMGAKVEADVVVGGVAEGKSEEL